MLAEGHLEGLELTGGPEHLEYGIHGFAGAAESQTAWRCQLRALNRPDAGHNVLTSERFSQALKDGVAAVYRSDEQIAAGLLHSLGEAEWCCPCTLHSVGAR